MILVQLCLKSKIYLKQPVKTHLLSRNTSPLMTKQAQTLNEGVDRGGGGTGVEGAESGVEGAESGVEGAGSGGRGGGKRG